MPAVTPSFVMQKQLTPGAAAYVAEICGAVAATLLFTWLLRQRED